MCGFVAHTSSLLSNNFEMQAPKEDLESRAFLIHLRVDSEVTTKQAESFSQELKSRDRPSKNLKHLQGMEESSLKQSYTISRYESRDDASREQHTRTRSLAISSGLGMRK
ncbi:hypothetical protein RRG08_025880 [Elysia crispata]|uniref:Uncharacterized protein n=1 Tax=Elysia crispata TaxID=231223 RepID=A0AAE0ZPJ5_9GAST|nr:hypothetical protein RRG08_025880 [Elysia crispata]